MIKLLIKIIESKKDLIILITLRKILDKYILNIFLIYKYSISINNKSKEFYFVLIKYIFQSFSI